MFYTTLDQIQAANTQLVNSFIKDEGIRTVVNEYIAAQTEFAKTTFKVGVDAATLINKQVSSILTK